MSPVDFLLPTSQQNVDSCVLGIKEGTMQQTLFILGRTAERRAARKSRPAMVFVVVVVVVLYQKDSLLSAGAFVPCGLDRSFLIGTISFGYSNCHPRKKKF